ncbi:hypothetical protein GLIP_3706 [Aliiglaciecola lipolytica E3]|uniref:Uncharacterized protein n=1 Tax=Aliiglaciecola lipolytica E3 TaxID=1127673 RepID=K6YDU3_9ALTE|nr:hypothetical protein GLIP_3706 [Aliiglaciecola lipolytica E3]
MPKTEATTNAIAAFFIQFLQNINKLMSLLVKQTKILNASF